MREIRISVYRTQIEVRTLVKGWKGCLVGRLANTRRAAVRLYHQSSKNAFSDHPKISNQVMSFSDCLECAGDTCRPRSCWRATRANKASSSTASRPFLRCRRLIQFISRLFALSTRSSVQEEGGKR